jgi:hypothetical protein
MIHIQRLPAAALPDDLGAQLENFSLFASPSFAGLWRTMGGLPVCWLLREEGKIAAALTGVEFRPHPLTRFQAMVDGLYGRLWLAPDSGLERPAALSLMMNALPLAGYARTFITDFHREYPEQNNYPARPCETTLVDISNPAWEPPDPTLRSEIRKAEREGITSVPFEADKHTEPFLKLMRQTEHRHGRSPKYTPNFFRELARLAQSDRRIRWRYCEIDGRPAASHVFLVDGTSALHWQVYFDKSFSFAKPNQFILFTMARELVADGVTILNLGASPPGADGLTAYKEKWGGTTYRYPLYYRYSWIGRLL